MNTRFIARETALKLKRTTETSALLAVLCCVTSAFVTPSIAQNCDNPNTALSTQAEVDDYWETIGCTVIETDLTIQGSDITDLSPLRGLKEINGSLTIISGGLQNLSGLDSLSKVGFSLIIRGSKISQLTGLEALRSVGSLDIISTNLVNLEGLASLERIGNDGLAHGEDLFLHQNGSLVNLTGLESLCRIDGDLQITFNPELLTLEGLVALDSAGGLSISDNFKLQNLNALENLSSLEDGIGISNNLNLCNCSIPLLCSILQERPERLGVVGNGIGCRSTEDIIASCQQEPVCLPALLIDHQSELSTESLPIDEDDRLLASLHVFGPGVTDLAPLSGIREIAGDLILSDLPISSLEDLNSLRRVDGDLSVNATDIQSLTGLELLTDVGGSFLLTSNPSLLSLSGLDSLRRAGEVVLQDLPIQSLSGLGGVEDLGGLTISNLSNLRSLQGLTFPEVLRGNLELLSISNLQEVTALQSIRSIEGSLTLSQLLNVPNLSLFSSLERIGGELWIQGNTSLLSLHGSQLSAIGGDIRLTGNENLCTCDIPPVCSQLAVGTSIELWGNRQDCNSANAIGQWCQSTTSPSCFGPRVLTSQSQIDKFAIDYPGLDQFNADLTIEGQGITNLNGLCQLKAINGTLYVQNNPLLEDLQGLDNLQHVEKLVICNNATLADLKGLSSIKRIDSEGLPNEALGQIRICNNPRLRTLQGLDSLTYVQALEISDNESLEMLDGLNQLKAVGFGYISTGPFDMRGLKISDNPSLRSLEGLSNLDSISGSFMVSGTKALSSLDGLAIEVLRGGILLIGNEGLQDLGALRKLTSVGGVTMGLGLGDTYQIYGSIYIADNASLERLTGLDSIKTIHLPGPGGDIHIFNNKRLSNIEGIGGIGSGIRGIFINGNEQLSNCQIESVCHFVTNLGQRLEILLNDTYVLRIEGNTGTCSGPKTVFDTCNGEGALEQITLYPNPVVTGFELSDWAAIRRLEVYALSGEIVQSREVQGLVDLSHLPTGLYVVSIVSNSDQSRQIKIIKQ